ncbi:MAG: tRNA dihydrouridine synthase DusB [Rhodobacteraceae bacterium]|nr:tRNA dihydrouridine synthase DusB [Paracoccaceae bacterium]
MSIDLGSTQLSLPVFLAPLAGITDLPFRNLVQSFGSGLVVSEMIASQEMVEAKYSVRDKAELGLGVENTSVQIAGRHPYWMSEAAKLVADQGARVIDINMGCSGSALMRDLDHALSLIDAVVKAVDVPVTLKTRLGWDDTLLNAPELARRAEDAGIRMIVIHGRTRCQFYKGHADWAAIHRVKQAVSIPVIANGDIVSSDHAKRAMAQSRADGVMVGRGAQGRPWAIAEIAHALTGSPMPNIPKGADLVDMIAGHYEAILGFYGTELGVRMARKHLGWYMDQAKTDRQMRRTLMTANDPRDVFDRLSDAILLEAA